MISSPRSGVGQLTAASVGRGVRLAFGGGGAWGEGKLMGSRLTGQHAATRGQRAGLGSPMQGLVQFTIPNLRKSTISLQSLFGVFARFNRVRTVCARTCIRLCLLAAGLCVALVGGSSLVACVLVTKCSRRCAVVEQA